jgi:hypothetical protein
MTSTINFKLKGIRKQGKAEAASSTIVRGIPERETKEALIPPQTRFTTIQRKQTSYNLNPMITTTLENLRMRRMT